MRISDWSSDVCSSDLPNRYPITPKPGYYDLKAYFNMANGSGKLRGIYAEGNVAAVPLPKEWLAPYASPSAAPVVAATTGRPAHAFLTSVGVPRSEAPR